MKDFLKTLGLKEENAGTSTGQNFMKEASAGEIDSYTPSDGSKIASVSLTTRAEYDTVRLQRPSLHDW